MWQLSNYAALGGLLLTGLMTVCPAQAGDRAFVDVIGYSADARYFAYEEFGVQDGSGFAYSSIYITDVDEDRWVVGTPAYAVAEDEDEPLAAVRRRVRDEIQPRLDDLDITLPAIPAALNGDGVPDSDRTTLAFGVPGYISADTEPGPVVGNYDLKIESFESQSSLDCMTYSGEPPRGYVLTISDFGASRVVHRDRSLPRSRGCPVAYALYGVYLPFEAADISRSVALISVFTNGFEGSDRRFLSVPLASEF